ncbi:sugar transferase [Enterococcus faecalis]|nr:sugar transferase [Enterococcus faecalis]
MCIQKIIALSLLIVVSPILLVAIICLKIESPKDSPIFIQQRVGYKGNLFNMYKLRTMRVHGNAEFKMLLEQNECSEVIFKIKKDPRITNVGIWLRKFSIDEFPQLFNVLLGEMDLVGPRPALVREIVKYSGEASRRLNVLPGCTGLWQISGRSNLDFQEMLELDLLYITKKSISYDIFILFKTIKVVIIGKGAY